MKLRFISFFIFLRFISEKILREIMFHGYYKNHDWWEKTYHFTFHWEKIRPFTNHKNTLLQPSYKAGLFGQILKKRIKQQELKTGPSKTETNHQKNLNKTIQVCLWPDQLQYVQSCWMLTVKIDQFHSCLYLKKFLNCWLSWDDKQMENKSQISTDKSQIQC